MPNWIVSLVALVCFASPFWQTKPPNQWSEQELQQLLTDSPWSQMAEGGSKAVGPAIRVFFATASIMEQAELERQRRAQLKRPKNSKAASSEPDPLVEEYREWLEANRASQIVVALSVPNLAAFSDEREVRRMEQESYLQAGRKKVKMTGHFAPSSGDPYLRLIFPRAIFPPDAQPTDKSIILQLYLPGVSIPYRQAEFAVKDMMVNGKLEL